MHLQLKLKGMPSSKLRMQKGYLLSIKCIRNGYLFYLKWYIKGKAVGPRGGTFPTITFLGIPPTPYPLRFVHMQWNHAKGMNLLNTTMGTKKMVPKTATTSFKWRLLCRKEMTRECLTLGPEVVGHSLNWAKWVCAMQQDMVFMVLSL